MFDKRASLFRASAVTRKDKIFSKIVTDASKLQPFFRRAQPDLDRRGHPQLGQPVGLHLDVRAFPAAVSAEGVADAARPRDESRDEKSRFEIEPECRHNHVHSYCRSEQWDLPGSAITNGREPRSCLGRVFNSKLGCIATLGSKCMVCMKPLLKLKTPPKACPVS